MYYDDSTKPVKMLSPGDTIREYKIMETIGTGGMAAVYKAQHTLIKQLVAIKVMKPSLTSDPQFCERFIREAQTQAQLTGHQNIVTIHNFIEEDGMYIIVMEYMDGIEVCSRRIRTLGQYLKEFGILSIEEVSPVLEGVIAGLCFAHEQGVVHRDIKPSNIMFSKKGVTKIVDFGIARIVSDPKLTRTGVAVGTPKYMSPEQVRGKELDERSDVYSLGITMYEALTGKTPFSGDTDYEIMRKQEEEPPLLPHVVKPDIPEVWEELIMQCMEKEPRNRPQSCREIERILQETTAKPGTRPEAVFMPNPSRPVSQPAPAIEKAAAGSTPVIPSGGPSRTDRGKIYKFVGIAGIVLISAGAYYFAFYLPQQRSSTSQPVTVRPNISEGELFSASPARRFTDIGNIVAHSDYVKEAYILCAEANLNEIIMQLRQDEPEITYVHFTNDKNVVIASSDVSLMGAVFNSDLLKAGPSTVKGREKYYEGAFEINADETRLGALYFGALLKDSEVQPDEGDLFVRRFTSVGATIAHATFVKDAYVTESRIDLKRHIVQFCRDIPEMQYIYFTDDSNRVIAANKVDMEGKVHSLNNPGISPDTVVGDKDRYEGYFDIRIGERKVGSLHFNASVKKQEKAGG